MPLLPTKSEGIQKHHQICLRKLYISEEGKMALKFLNKKGWHTGSLRNIENVWKAEQKHEAEEKKLEELKKQIQDEREQHEFRLLQEQAGLVPRQERLEFLYDSGLSVGKNSGESFPLGKPGDPTKNEQQPDANKLPSAPGALFQEEKPASANDTWRKIHSDPLLMIRQREQEALAKIKNNPVKMEIIKKSVQQEKVEEDKKKSDKKKHHKDKKNKKHISNDTDSGDDSHREERKSKKGKYKHDSFSNRDEMDGDRKDNRTSKEFLLNKKSQSSYQGERQRSPSPVRQVPQAKRNESRSSLEKRHADSPSGRHKRHRRRSRSVEDRGRNKYSNDGYRERSGSPNNLDRSRSHNNGHRHRSRSPNNRDRNRSSNHEHRRRSRSPENQDRNRASNNEQRHRSRSPDNQDWNMSSNNGNRHRLRSPDNQDRNRSSNNWHRQRSGSPGNQDRSRSSNNWQRHRSPPKYEKTDKLSTSNGIFSVANGENVKASSGYSDKRNVNEPSNASNGRVAVARSTAHNKSRTGKLSEEEKAARLREMQRDAEIHEEQRWRRLKKAADADEKEALESAKPVPKNFLDVTTKSIYGAEKGGSSTIEESIRRRTHYSQGSALDGNAFRR